MQESSDAPHSLDTASPDSSASLDIYCVAIGGTGMAPLACLLQELGHGVRGADGPLYPPMSTLLERAGIQPLVGFDPAHLNSVPDLVIIGNAVPRQNPEAVATEERGLERISMPQAIHRFLLPGRRPLVVAGTHGKTTTTSIASWVYTHLGADPGYLIGGAPRNLPASFHLGSGDRFVIEGDEYNASYFDRGPKFLHYAPQTVILTSAEYDHADLYSSPEALRQAYRSLLELLPEDGLLVACGDDEEICRMARDVRCPVVLYGFEEHNDLRPVGSLEGLEMGPSGSRFSLADGASEETQEAKTQEIQLAVPGRHNVLNAMAVWAVARRDGHSAASVADALGRFQGVQRRLEELGTVGGATVVDDFAHHPTAVRESLLALRRRHPEARIIALFEPRSLTAGREFFYDAYRDSFRNADRVLLAPIFHAGRLSDEERLDLGALAADLGAAGVETTCCSDIDDLLERAVAEAAPGTVLVTMSSGAFDGLPRRLLAALGERS